MNCKRQLLPVTGFVAAVLLSMAQPSRAGSMALPGTFAVNSMGAATYTIPIAVPPGTAGVVPSLSLEYNSQAGDGIMGIGWSLGGLPAITRCPATIAQDGQRRGINFSSSDRFCLDGQRLVQLFGDPSGGPDPQYRTEIESYSRIISHGNTANGFGWFEVHTKSGQIMEFGQSTDSLILAEGRNVARKWALNKLSDTKGNYFTISYVNDATNGEFYPSEINYTGNSAAGLSPYNKVQFVYTARPDITPVYQDITSGSQAGSLVRITKRLTNVKTFAAGVLVSDYRISYQQDGTVPVSRVGTISLCASDGSCIPATTFGTTGAGDGSLAAIRGRFPDGWGFFANPPQAGWMSIPGDFNGDGKGDFAMAGWSNVLRTLTSNGDGSFNGSNFLMPPGWCQGAPPQATWTLITGDFNGDGKSDFGCLQNNVFHTFLSNGNGSFAPNTYVPGIDFGSPPTAHWSAVAGDFDGDGRGDFALLQGPEIAVYYSNGDGSFTGSFGWFQDGTNLGNPPSATWTLIPGDFNGDGQSDFALLQNNTLMTFISSKPGFNKIVYLVPNGWSYGSPADRAWMPLAGDFNGDGKSDFAMLQGTRVQTFLSKGDGRFSASNFDYSTTVNFGNPPQSSWMPSSGDFNGDGKTDFAMLSGTSLKIFLSKGDGTFVPVSQSVPWNFGSPPTASFMPVSGDFNGDGKLDFAMVLGDQVYIVSAGNTPFHLLSSMTGGLGASIAVTYAPLTNTSVYAKDNNAVYPVQDIENGLRVVSRVDASNGLGGTHRTTYAYAGGKIDVTGRFLGFRKMVSTDLQTNIVQTDNFRQDFPFIGMLESKSKTFNGRTLNQVVNTFQFLNSWDQSVVGRIFAPYRIRLSQSVESGSDLDGSTIPTVTSTYQYDKFGNATQVSVANSDGYSKTTNSTYSNDGVKWLLGRLSASTVTSQAPRQAGQ